jgi:FkbM family methyltransferase
MADTPTLSFAYKAHQAVLNWHQHSGSWARPLRWAFVEWPVRILAQIESRRRGISFPRRAIGGWWWIWRFRFDIVMGFHEYPSVQWCRRLIRRGSTVLDIGSHIGYYSWILSDITGPEGKVYSFEASPENFPVLVHNLQATRATNVEPIHAAVADRAGTLPLHVSPGHSNHSLVRGYTDSKEIVHVPAVTIDGWLSARGVSRISFVKIDTEGAEIMVLEGMREVIRNSPDLTMLVELNPRAHRAAGRPPQKLLEVLADLGFETREIDEWGRLNPPLTLAEPATRNLLCYRPGYLDRAFG